MANGIRGAGRLRYIMTPAAEYHSRRLGEGATLRLENYFDHQNSLL